MKKFSKTAAAPRCFSAPSRILGQLGIALLWSLLWSTYFTFSYLTTEEVWSRQQGSSRRYGHPAIYNHLERSSTFDDRRRIENATQGRGQWHVGTDKKAANVKHATTTKETMAHVDTLQDLAKSFYEHHLSSITTIVNESTALIWNAQSTTNPFGPFKDEFENMQIVPWEIPDGFEPQLHTNSSSTHYILWRDICTAAKTLNAMRQRSDYKPFPLIHLLRFHENMGEFSEHVPNRTTDDPNYTYLTGERVWKSKGCTRQDILAYMDHDDTRALVTTQHSLLDHPKLYCLPLGVRSQYDLNLLLRELREPTSTAAASMNALPRIIAASDKQATIRDVGTDRPQLLMINSRPRKMRLHVLDMVIHNLQALGVKNTYNPRDAYTSYLREMRQSKFILSPSGLGMDCYRHWVAILMGTIPVMEHLNREDAWYRTLEDLPILWVDSYENLTEDSLESEYRRIMSNSKTYNYHKLTKQWWIHTIKSTLSLPSSP